MANQYSKIELFVNDIYNYDEEILSDIISLSVVNIVTSFLPNNKEVIDSFIEELLSN